MFDWFVELVECSAMTLVTLWTKQQTKKISRTGFFCLMSFTIAKAPSWMLKGKFYCFMLQESSSVSRIILDFYLKDASNVVWRMTEIFHSIQQRHCAMSVEIVVTYVLQITFQMLDCEGRRCEIAKKK